MKKGFMHVVELLLIIIIVFFVFSQFASIPSIAGEWPRTKLGIMAGDTLKALETKGVDWFNRTDIENGLNNTLAENIIYAVRLQNVIKPRIRAGCLCSSYEFSRMRNEVFRPDWFVINGVNTTFELVQVTDINEAFSLDYDVVLVAGYRDLGLVQYPVRNFLAYDKGVVEIFDAIGQDPSNVQRNVFGIAAGAMTSDGSNIVFSPAGMQTGAEANKIYETSLHLPLFYEPFNTLDEWAGSADLAASPALPAPSVRLYSNSCSGEEYIFTRFFSSFRNGEIDFDVYLDTGASLFIGFSRSSSSEYLASVSNNVSVGYDSFHQREPMRSMGTNTSHLTDPLRWNHVKIIARDGTLSLYNNGINVASAQAAGMLGSNISLYNKCGTAYVDNFRITPAEKWELANFLAGENITQASATQSKILLVQKGTSIPACVINYDMEDIGKGRTAWLSNATSISEEYKNLVKALVVWAAGSDYTPVKAELKKPVSAFFYKSLGSDMQQNAKIILELDYLY